MQVCGELPGAGDLSASLLRCNTLGSSLFDAEVRQGAAEGRRRLAGARPSLHPMVLTSRAPPPPRAPPPAQDFWEGVPLLAPPPRASGAGGGERAASAVGGVPPSPSCCVPHVSSLEYLR